MSDERRGVMNFSFDEWLNGLRGKSRESNASMAKCTVVFVVLAVADVCFDVFFPDVQWGNYVRPFLALLTGVPLFMAGYQLACRQHDAKQELARENDDDYVSYRLRYSARSRMTQSAITGAFLIVLAIITSYTPVYTLGAGIVIAGCIALASYCRLTHDERILRDNDLPDPRDVLDAADRESEEMDMQARKELRREEINRRKARMRAEASADDDDDDDDEEDDYDEEDDDGKRKKPSLMERLF